MSRNDHKVMILYYGGHHQSLTIYEDYINGVQKYYSDVRLLDYFDLYLRQGVRRFTGAVINEVEQYKRDLIFFMPGSGDMTFPAVLIEKLSTMAYMVINFFDSEIFFDNIDRHYAQAAGLVLVPNPGAQALFSSIETNTYCTYSLFDPERYPCKGVERATDVSFVGNLTKANRRRYIEFLMKNGITVSTFGYGTSSGIICQEKMVDVFNRTKISLNFSDAEQSGLVLYSRKESLIPQLKGRITEAALTGSFVLTEYAPGLDEMYEIGKEIDIFHDQDELLQKVRYYLAHPIERDTIATAGRQRALRDYDCRRAFQNIDGLIADRNEHRQIKYDEMFEHNQANFLFYYFVRFALTFRLVKAFFEIKHICAHARLDFRQAMYLGVRAIAACCGQNRLFAWVYTALKLAIISLQKKQVS